MKLDLSGLNEEEKAAVAESLDMLKDQPPLPNERAVEFSNRLVPELADLGLLGVVSEEKYELVYSKAINDGFSEEDAEQIVEHYRFGDKSMALLPESVKNKVFQAAKDRQPIEPPKL